jgi:hypothetical protein
LAAAGAGRDRGASHRPMLQNKANLRRAKLSIKCLEIKEL